MFILGSLFSSTAFGKDPEQSDVDEVVISESDTQTDEEENTDEPTTTMEVAEDVSNVIIQDNATTAPLDQSASLETELLPLVTDPDPATPESELKLVKTVQPWKPRSNSSGTKKRNNIHRLQAFH